MDKTCIKCGLETDQSLYTEEGPVAFCGWCYQKLMGQLRQDDYQSLGKREIWIPAQQ